MPQTIKASKAAARAAHLRYVSDDTTPGIRRVRKGAGFAYLNTRGKRITNPRTLGRIKSLVLPPAWTDVWITTDPRGHLQATGRDDRGRKQSKYHPRFREERDQDKYDRMIDFARVLPKIRRRCRGDLGLKGLPREKVLAGVVRLLEKTLLRIGNDEYAKSHNHFGLTTMHNRHAKVRGSRISFRFVGKSGVVSDVDLEAPRLARLVKECQDLPGQGLFEYVDEEGKRHDVKSSDVNDYLREITGEDFTAKDFRTWAGTMLAVKALRVAPRARSERESKKYVVAAVDEVARSLGNTRAVCRKCYIHPAVLDAFMNGTLTKSRHAPNGDERAVVHLLRRAGKAA